MTWQQDNADYWAAHAHEYPHWAVQTESITAGYTRPEHLETRRHGEFLRVPTGEKVFWGFKKEVDRDAFISDFGGAVLLPTDPLPQGGQED